MPPLLKTEGLRKNYGRFCAVRGFDIEVAEGEILGFIGPNGAGKSTTLKMLATILRPSAGDAFVCGKSVVHQAKSVRRLIGYMPDVCGLYEDMIVEEYLRFFATVYGARGTSREEKVSQALEITGLTGKAQDLCGALSRGMSQRLHLARVLLHDPKLLLLDEPASGLDPRARIELKELVLALRDLGKTIVISSHILSELGEMCDSIAVIEKSELVYHGPVKEVMDRVETEGRVYSVRLEPPQVDAEAGSAPGLADLSEFLPTLRGVDGVRDGDLKGELYVRLTEASPAEILRELVTRGYLVVEFSARKTRLEDAFLHITKGIVQ